MLCSIPTSGKSTSNWLARLRSSKGFPSGADLDLDQFLAHHRHSHQDDSLPPKPVLPQPETASQTEPSQMPNPSQGRHLMFNLMSNVLAELFIMRGDSNASPKCHPHKCSRKQPNPRFCGPLNSPGFSFIGNDNSNNDDAATNGDPLAKRDSASPLSDDNSGVGLVKELRGDERVKLVENVSSGEEEEEDEEDKDKGCWKLSGFSRTEVTVIDTSFARWKFEKMLFRKKNVWKVRDKKGKTANFTKKKRKSSSVEDENFCRGDVKKAKVLDGQLVFSEKGNGASKEEYLQSNKSQATCTMTSDNFGKAVKKKQASSNLEKGSSSVILIKSIPANRKVGSSIPKSCAKSTQKQPKV